jgi:hypothetical protein
MGSADLRPEKKPLTKKQKIWISVAVLAFVGLIAANKIMGPSKPDDAATTISQGIAPIIAPKAGVNANADSKNAATAPLMGVAPGKAVQMNQPIQTEQVTSYNNTQAIQSVLSMASNNTVTMLQSWTGPGGLTGVLYKDINGKEGIAWVNTAKQLVMIGTLVGANGTNYNTSSDFALAAQTGASPANNPAPEPEAISSAESTLASLMTGGNGFVEGMAGPELTVYIDPNSKTGHQLYLALSPETKEGKIRVRYVPVAEKSKSSLHKAEEIMAAPVPAEDMRKDERLFKKSPNGEMEGGIRGVPSTLDMVQEIDGNTALIVTAGYINTPVMVYCNKAGKHQVAVGKASAGDLSAIMNNLGACTDKAS